MKSTIVEVYGCQTCPLSFHNSDSKEWFCANYKTKPKLVNIELNEANKYPKWCPLKNKPIKLILR